MTREEASKRFEALLLHVDTDCVMGMETTEAIKMAIQALEQPEQRWISCSERMPDVAQRVLLSGHGQVMVGMLHSFGKYSLEPTGLSYAYPKDDIEAWMPLPEPWKGEKDEHID